MPVNRLKRNYKSWAQGKTVELFRDQAALQVWLTSLGASGPLVSIALNAAQALTT